MSLFFSAEDRQAAVEKLLDYFKADGDVVGLVQFEEDTQAAVQMMAVLKETPALTAACSRCWKAVANQFAITDQIDETCSDSCCRKIILLDNYLVLDLTLTAAPSLTPPPYRVCFDKEGHLANALQPAASKPVQDYPTLMAGLWLPVIQCGDALRREDIWRALYLLDGLRERLIGLAGLRHEVDTRAYRQMHELPEMFVIQLRHTLPISTSITGIRRALRTTVQMIFKEAEILDQQQGTTFAQKSQSLLRQYLEAYG